MGDAGRYRGTEERRVAGLVGELLDALADKVRSAGPDAVRVLTEEELQRHQLSWFRAGWEEHARACGDREHPVGRGHPAAGPDARPTAPLLRFPERPRGHEGPPGDGG